MRQQKQEPSKQISHISGETLQALQKKSFEELSNEFLMMGGEEKQQEDLMDAYVQLMQEKCPPDDASFDFDSAMGEVKAKIAAQSDPVSSKYDFLQSLSKEDLELLLEAKENSREAQFLFDAVERAVMGRYEIEVVANQEHEIPSKNKQEKAQHKGKVFRTLGTVAAVVVLSVALTVGGMVGAQASGLNVFGALAEWTDELFHYVPAPAANGQIRNALLEQGIPEELAPAWVPERFELQGVDSYSNDEMQGISVGYISGTGVFCVEANKYAAPAYLVDSEYQKNPDGVTTFISHGRKFYIFTNLECTTATWSDGQSLSITAWGDVTAEEMMDIISSIGG